MAEMLVSPPMVGKEKYLGGVLDPVSGNIFAIPGNAERVLRISPDTGECKLVGPVLKGKFKWLRGVLGDDGCIYGIPCWADNVLKIDPATDEVTTFGDGLGTEPWKWHGGVAQNGAIYGIPANATAVIKIVPRTGQVSIIGGPFPGDGKWYGGLLGFDGAIYGVPTCADCVLKIDPDTDEVTTFGKLAPDKFKWHGGVVGADGSIIGIPCNADSVLRIVPETSSVEMLGKGLVKTGKHRTDGKYKFLGGVLGGDGCVYAMPSDSDHVLRVSTRPGETPTVSNIGRTLEFETFNQNKWQNGFLGADDCIYGIPLKSETVLRIDPVTAEVSTIGGPFKGHNKWEGGVVGLDGALYCMPLKCHQVMAIKPAGSKAAKKIAARRTCRQVALSFALAAIAQQVGKRFVA